MLSNSSTLLVHDHAKKMGWVMILMRQANLAIDVLLAQLLLAQLLLPLLRFSCGEAQCDLKWTRGLGLELRNSILRSFVSG